MFPSLEHTNALIHPFGMVLERSEATGSEYEKFVLTGEDTWRHTLPGGSFHDFLTVGHFWVDWLWFAAHTLETYRKNTLLFQEFCRRDCAGRVALLHEIQAYHYAQGSLEVSELLAGQVITPDTLSPYQGDFSRALAFPGNSNDCDWASVLLTALSLPMKGAEFYYGHSCSRAWAVDPEAMKTYEVSRYGRTFPLNESASLACSN